MNRKQREIIFIVIMAFCCMSTANTVTELILGSPGMFMASLGPFLAGWALYFGLRKKVSEAVAEVKNDANTRCV